MEDILKNIVMQCDLILSQLVSDDYRGNAIFSTSTSTLKSYIKPEATHLISNCYFTGYDPIPFQITDAKHNIIHLDNVSYFPSISLLLEDIEEAYYDWNNLDVYNHEQLEYNYLTTMNNLKGREDKIFNTEINVNIKISDYIEANYKLVHLFHT